MPIRIYKNNSGIGGIILFYAMISTLFYCLPAIKYSTTYIPMALILLFSYILFLMVNRRDSNLIISIMLLSLVLGFMEFAVSSGGLFVEGINEFIRSLRFFAPLLIFIMINQYCSKRQIAMYVVFVTALFMFVMYKTNIAIEENATISRQLATGLSNDVALYPYRMQNVGGFEFCYAVGFVVIVALYMMKYKDRRVIQVLSLGLFVLTLIFVFKTQYMILLLLVASFSILFWYLSSERGLKRAVVTVGCIVIICLIPTIMFKLSVASFSSTLQVQRFESFLSVFQGESLMNSSSRFEKYLASFVRFLDSPIWGSININNLAHSTFLGVLECKGIIGFVAWIALLKKAYARIKFEIQNRYELERSSIALIDSMYYMLLVLALFNPIQYCFEVCFIVYLFMPCVICLFSEEVNMNES